MLFASTHLSFGDEQTAVRVDQLAAARAGLDDMRESGEPVALAGDLNEGPSGAAISAATAGGYLDAWHALHPTDPGPTFPASAPSKRIDYVLLSVGTSGIEAAAAEIFLDQAQGATLPSDHLGVRVDLEHP
jgi:endonuclease/exonuclease/phosphatase family metal-dependent hydrolase